MLRHLRTFCNLDQRSSENIVEFAFGNLFASIGTLLEAELRNIGHIPYAVGGLLAESEYCIVGRTDSCFTDAESHHILRTEFKTDLAWPLSRTYYHGSRGPQLFGNLFAVSNQICPVLLLTQKQFKLFMQNPDRDSILTFPTLYATLATNTDSFLQILGICALAARPSMESTSPAPVPTSSELIAPMKVPPTVQRLQEEPRIRRDRKRRFETVTIGQFRTVTQDGIESFQTVWSLVEDDGAEVLHHINFSSDDDSC